MFKYFKEQFIKPTILYSLYRMYKFRPFVSHSAFGEEILVNRIFKNIDLGFYVDVGALNPRVGSLTYQLYKKGWSGINIDLTEENIKLFKLMRKRDISIQIAVSDKKKILESYIFDVGSGLNTLEKKHAKSWSKKINKEFKTVKIRSDTLTSIIFNNAYYKNFEYLNIDVESHELNVLKGFDFKQFRPKLITIEIHGNDIEKIKKSDVYKYLVSKRYKLVSFYHLTCFFIPIENTLD